MVASGGSRISQKVMPTPKKWECQPIIRPNFVDKSMKRKNIRSGGGVHPKFLYVDPPLVAKQEIHVNLPRYL